MRVLLIGVATHASVIGEGCGGTSIVVVLTLTHGHTAVRGHRTGSNNPGVED